MVLENPEYNPQLVKLKQFFEYAPSQGLYAISVDHYLVRDEKVDEIFNFVGDLRKLPNILEFPDDESAMLWFNLEY